MRHFFQVDQTTHEIKVRNIQRKSSLDYFVRLYSQKMKI